MNRGRKPDFLIIGAMKAGTTTVFRDLAQHSSIYFPAVKEPGNLSTDDVLSSNGRQRYYGLYEGAPPEQACGDASTAYSKRPVITGVAQRAKQVIGEDLRLIYIIRDPVERAISHYKHLVTHHGLRCDFSTAISQYSRIVDYGRYAYQLEPWLDYFPKERLCVIKLDDIISQRLEAYTVLCWHVGVKPEPDSVNESEVFNTSSDSHVLGAAGNWLKDTSIYKNYIRGKLPRSIRQGIVSLVGCEADEPTVSIPPQTREYLVNTYRKERDMMTDILGEDEVLWRWEDRGD